MTSKGQTWWIWDNSEWSILDSTAPHWTIPNPPPADGSSFGQVVITQNIELPGEYPGFNIYGCLYRYDARSRQLNLYRRHTPEGYGCDLSLAAAYSTGRHFVIGPVKPIRPIVDPPPTVDECIGTTKYECQDPGLGYRWVILGQQCAGETGDNADCCQPSAPIGECNEANNGKLIITQCVPDSSLDGCQTLVYGCNYQWDGTSYQLITSNCRPGCVCLESFPGRPTDEDQENVFKPCICPQQVIAAQSSSGESSGSSSGESGGPGGGSPADP